jgi:hypothetical protein
VDHDVWQFLVPALATIAVAWVSTRGGKRAAEKEEPFAPNDHGEHAHTRDIVKLEAQRVVDRIDASDFARGLRHQSDQRGLSLDRVAHDRGKRLPDED